MVDKGALTKEIFTALLMLGVTIPFALSVGDIYIDPSDPGFGSQDLPRLTIFSIIGLSLILLVRACVKLVAGYREEIPWPVVIEQARVIAGIAVLAALYIWAIILFQYALPTFVILVALVYFFGSRGMGQLIVLPLVLVCIYYFVFFVIFGLYEEPGTLMSYDSYSFARQVRVFIGLN